MFNSNVASQHAFSANSANGYIVSRSMNEPIEGMLPLTNGHDPKGSGTTSGTVSEAAALMPDMDEACRFLAILAPSETRFTFQTFDDNKARKKADAERERKNAKAEGRKPRRTDAFAQTIEGTLDECWPELVSLNRAGAGIFVTVNRTALEARRRDENITHIRGVIQDDDRGCDESQLPLDATVKVETSPGKYQRLWLAMEPWQADVAGRADYAAMMVAVVTKYGGDPNAKDAARVFRLPGFYHRKGAPHRVRIADASEARYSREELIKAFAPAGVSAANDNVDAGRQRAEADKSRAETRPLAAAADLGLKPESGGWRAYSARAEMELRSALGWLKGEAEDYSTWFGYGLAIYRLGWGERGFAVWRHWASTWPEFCEDDCLAKWDGDLAAASQRDARGITIATVYDTAKKRAWPGFPFSHGDYEALAALPDADAIDKFNAEFAFIADPPSYYSFGSETLLRKEAFLDLTANRYRMVEVQTAKGGVKEERVDTAPEWRKSRRRRHHGRVVFEPDQLRVTRDGNLNLFKGLPVAPKPGCVKPFVKLVLRNTGGNRRHARFMLDWLAHKLQHPAVKMKTAVFVMSYENGVGKGLLIDKVAELFGEYYTPITTKDQKSDFNEYKACKLLSVCDEATYTGRLDLAEAIKNEITAPVIHVNEKYKPKYTVKNLSELWITSNRADGVLIRDKDRRYAAFRAVETRIPEQEALDYVAWFDRGGGKEAVMDYLLRRDLSGFNPHAPAPETAFKRSLIDVNRTSHQQLVADLAEDCGGRPLRELKEVLSHEGVLAGSAALERESQFLGRELQTAGAPKRRLRIGGILYSLWAVTDYNRWDAASNEEWGAQWQKQHGERPEEYNLEGVSGWKAKLRSSGVF